MNPKSSSRTRRLIGDVCEARLEKSKVAVFGLGGVGSYVVEALARAGVGGFVIIDGDTVDEPDLNRQIIATNDTLGKKKTEAARERILSINPEAEVTEYPLFYLPATAEDVELDGCDYIVDAIDNVTAKLMIAEYGRDHEIPVISSMGTGNRLDPTRFRITDIYKTAGDPLARAIRRECRSRGIEKLTVLVSDEDPVPVTDTEKNENGKVTPASISFVPSAAGLIIAGHVIKELAGLDN